MRTTNASARWARIIQQQAASGLSITEFCRRRELAQPTFFVWRRRLRVGVDTDRASPAFVELKVAGQDAREGDAGTLELVLPGGRRVMVRRGFDRQTLLELMAALEESA